MNQREKLQEATILALQGKLNESIDWKKDIHEQNYDYGNKGRVDYPDEVYNFGTFYINNTEFCVTYTQDSYKNPEFNKSWDINSIHPYDEAEYCWARAYDGENEYKIYKSGSLIEKFKVSDVSKDSEIERVAQRLLELDAST